VDRSVRDYLLRQMTGLLKVRQCINGTPTDKVKP
jgi:hypothetical protein